MVCTNRELVWNKIFDFGKIFYNFGVHLSKPYEWSRMLHMTRRSINMKRKNEEIYIFMEEDRFVQVKRAVSLAGYRINRSGI